MEDEEFPKDWTWDIREMEWEDWTYQDSRPPTDQHIDCNPPFRRAGCGPDLRERVTQKGKQDASVRFYRFVLHDLRKMLASSVRLEFSTLTIFKQFFPSLPGKVATKF
jgi:hypothetical protein